MCLAEQLSHTHASIHSPRNSPPSHVHTPVSILPETPLPARYTHEYPFSPELPSQPGCYITLSRVFLKIFDEEILKQKSDKRTSKLCYLSYLMFFCQRFKRHKDVRKLWEMKLLMPAFRKNTLSEWFSIVCYNKWLISPLNYIKGIKNVTTLLLYPLVMSHLYNGVSWGIKMTRQLNKLCPSRRRGFPDISVGKESTCNLDDLGSILGLGRSPGEGNGNPLHHSGLEDSMDCIVHGVAKSRSRLSLSWQSWFWLVHIYLQISSVYKDTNHSRRGPHPNAGSHLNSLHPQWPYFQNRSRFEVRT